MLCEYFPNFPMGISMGGYGSASKITLSGCISRIIFVFGILGRGLLRFHTTARTDFS
jgi:hypothetical protein